MQKCFCFNKRVRGQLLLEVLIASVVLIIIVGFGSQLLVGSARSSKWSRERGVAQGLAEEAIEAVQGVALEKWQDVYQPPDGTGDAALTKGNTNHYAVEQQDSKWIVQSGDETISLNGVVYTRYFYVENVSRDPTSRAIESTYNSSNDDPSTQKVTAVVSWPNADPYVLSTAVTRWRNKVCRQTDWGGGASGGVNSCPTTMYGSADAAIDLGAANSLKLKAQ